jgi:hypothetical protein
MTPAPAFAIIERATIVGHQAYTLAMPRKPKPLPDDPEESKRFIDMAREVGAEKASPDFERIFRKVAEQPKGSPPKPTPRRAGGKPS